MKGGGNRRGVVAALAIALMNRLRDPPAVDAERVEHKLRRLVYHPVPRYRLAPEAARIPGGRRAQRRRSGLHAAHPLRRRNTGNARRANRRRARARGKVRR